MGKLLKMQERRRLLVRLEKVSFLFIFGRLCIQALQLHLHWLGHRGQELLTCLTIASYLYAHYTLHAF
jgi:hypothetical protein